MTSRRAFVGGALVLAMTGTALAQSARKPARVAVLNGGSASKSPAVQREPFERGLRELGWTPGADLVIDYRYAEGDLGRLRELAADVVARGADVIVARGDPVITAAQRATTTMPIVMSSGSDPVASGFVRTLARPDGNITGIANVGSALENKRLELLKEAVPGLSRVALLTRLVGERDSPDCATPADRSASRSRCSWCHDRRISPERSRT